MRDGVGFFVGFRGNFGGINRRMFLCCLSVVCSLEI